MGKYRLINKEFCEVENKVRYSSKGDARIACSSLKDVTPYYCPHCHGFHVTTKRNKFFNGTLQHMPRSRKTKKAFANGMEYVYS